MSDNKYDKFKHYMLAGHGRAFKYLETGEKFRELVLYGCLNDLAFDIQSEGSRACFMYNLALQFDDYTYFLNPAIEKFSDPEVNDDLFNIWHLCDFIDYFAVDSGDLSTKSVIDKKYEELYSLIMTMRYSAKANEIIQSFEYLAITVIQHNDFKQALKVFGDIGAYFLRRRNTPDDDLKWHFDWFCESAREEYGEEFLKEKLELHSRNSKEIRRFNRVMNSMDKEFERTEYPKPTAGEFIEKAMNSAVTRRDILMLRKAEESDIIRIANAFLSESDPNIKADLLSAFTSRYSPFPLDTTTIIECAKSQNKKLRSTAVYAIKFVKNNYVHDFAVKKLKENFSVDMLEILIHNYHEADNDLILGFLEKLPFDLENESGWHGVISEILNTAENNEISKELLIFAYENTLCSCCREYIFDELKKRNLLTAEMIMECVWDCNENIRKKAKNLSEKKQ